MDTWNCECGNSMSVDSYKEQGGVNDSYILIYECNNCKSRKYTTAKNTKDVNGAKVIKVMDRDVYSQKQINDEIAKLTKDKED